MGGSSSKRKGKAWEREVADFLTDLYREPFTRVPYSGAFIGGSNSHRINSLSESQVRAFKGDIIPGPSFERLNIECKSYKEFPFHQFLFQGDIKLLDEWIGQTLEVAHPTDINLLIMKFNRKGTYIGFETKISLATHRHVIYKEWTFTGFKDFWQLNSNAIKQLCQAP